MLKDAVIWGVGLLMAVLCTSCSKQQAEAMPDGAVARVGDRYITGEELVQEARGRLEAGRPVPEPAKLLEELIGYESQLYKANLMGLADDPSVQKEINRLLVARLRQRELAEALRAADVTDDELKAEYERSLSRYTRPGMDRFAILRLKVSRSASVQTRESLQGRMEQALQNAQSLDLTDGFGPLSVNFSDDQMSRYRGGDIGWIAHGAATSRIPQAVLEAGRALPVGTHSSVIEADNGFYVIVKTDVRPESVEPFEQVRTALRHGLLTERRKQIEAEYLKLCADEAGVELYEAPLRTVRFEIEQAKPVKTQQAMSVGIPAMVQ